MAMPQPIPTPEAGDTVLMLKRRFDAPRERVYQAWTDPAQIVKWWGPKGVTIPVCDVDLEVGGTFRSCMHHADGDDYYLTCVYKEILPPEKLVFTWTWEQGRFKDLETLVTIKLEEDGEGTILTLIHERLADREARDLHNQGWCSSLDDCLADLF